MSTPEQNAPQGAPAPAARHTPDPAPEPARPAFPPTAPTPAEAAPTAADLAAEKREREERELDVRARETEAFPVPTGPRTTNFGGHLLGILVGLLLAIIAGILVVLGQSRILAQGVGLDVGEVSPETVGIVLVTLGALVAGGIVLLGMWTPAAPFTAGLVAVAVGAAFLFAPIQAHKETVRMILTEQNRTGVLDSITVGTSGGVFIAGILLLAAATALSIVRRRGLALGTFRERSRAASPQHY